MKFVMLYAVLAAQVAPVNSILVTVTDSVGTTTQSIAADAVDFDLVDAAGAAVVLQPGAVFYTQQAKAADGSNIGPEFNGTLDIAVPTPATFTVNIPVGMNIATPVA